MAKSKTSKPQQSNPRQRATPKLTNNESARITHVHLDLVIETLARLLNPTAPSLDTTKKHAAAWVMWMLGTINRGDTQFTADSEHGTIPLPYGPVIKYKSRYDKDTGELKDITYTVTGSSNTPDRSQ